MSLLDQLSQRYEDLLSGKLKFWELPEFRGFAEQLSAAGHRGREAMAPQLHRMGIRGPAMAAGLDRAQQGAMAPLAGFGRSILEGIPQFALSKEALDIQSWLGQLQLREQRKTRRASQEGVNLGILGRWGT